MMGAHVSIPTYQNTAGERLAFEGGQCPNCETVNFPERAACTACGHVDEFETVELTGDGTVYTYTVLSPGGAPPEFAEEARIEGRYVVAVVELSEGPHVTAQLTDVQPDDVAIGMPVTGRIRRIYEEEGVVRYGFKFAPKRE